MSSMARSAIVRRRLCKGTVALLPNSIAQQNRAFMEVGLTGSMVFSKFLLCAKWKTIVSIWVSYTNDFIAFNPCFARRAQRLRQVWTYKPILKSASIVSFSAVQSPKVNHAFCQAFAVKQKALVVRAPRSSEIAGPLMVNPTGKGKASENGIVASYSTNMHQHQVILKIVEEFHINAEKHS